MKYIELKNLARKAFPCKIFQGKNLLARSFKEKISLQDLSRKKFPCKIFQGKHFLARSFKENISLQDLARNKFPCKILQVIAFLQGSCKILARNAFFLDQGQHANAPSPVFKEIPRNSPVHGSGLVKSPGRNVSLGSDDRGM